MIKHEHQQRGSPAVAALANPRRFAKCNIMVMCLAIVALAGAMALFNRSKPQGRPAVSPSTGFKLSQVAREIPAFAELLTMPHEQLQGLDIATMDLLCATGLPGAEKLDIPGCLTRLDRWAAKVRAVTQQHLYRAHDPRYADHYKHSESWLKAEFLAQVLQEDCGVHYNMERATKVDFSNSKDLFIHGMIDDANGGTCASMPVLYVAVGRRLGYPLKLVLTKGHVFVRWEDSAERFNIETTSNGGTDSYPDEHYLTWPEKLTEAEVKANCYLISLSPAEELATFMANRGHCLLDNGRKNEAEVAYSAAHRLDPLAPAYLDWMRQAENRVDPQLAGRNSSPIDDPARVYRQRVAEADRINAINQNNMKRIMQPAGSPQQPMSPRPNMGLPPSVPGTGIRQPPY